MQHTNLESPRLRRFNEFVFIEARALFYLFSYIKQ